MNVYAGEVFLKMAGRQSEKVALRSVPFQLGEPAHEADYRDIVFYFYVFFSLSSWEAFGSLISLKIRVFFFCLKDVFLLFYRQTD